MTVTAQDIMAMSRTVNSRSVTLPFIDAIHEFTGVKPAYVWGWVHGGFNARPGASVRFQRNHTVTMGLTTIHGTQRRRVGVSWWPVTGREIGAILEAFRPVLVDVVSNDWVTVTVDGVTVHGEGR